MTPRIAMRWLEGADTTLPLPSYETAGAAGADLRANFPDKADRTLEPGTRALIPTGLAVEIPAGFEMQIRPRWGSARFELVDTLSETTRGTGGFGSTGRT